MIRIFLRWRLPERYMNALAFYEQFDRQIDEVFVHVNVRDSTSQLAPALCTWELTSYHQTAIITTDIVRNLKFVLLGIFINNLNIPNNKYELKFVQKTDQNNILGLE